MNTLRVGWAKSKYERVGLSLAIAVAVIFCYSHVIAGLIAQWREDEDMSHGFLVPFCIAWVLWRERGRWWMLAPQPNPWGLLVVAAGAAGHLASASGAGLFAGSLALLTTITGVVLTIGGTAYLRAWLFPLTLTVFMLPKLAVVHNQTTLPLQLLATRIAAAMVSMVVGGVAVDGNILHVASRHVSVEEACNGLRYLLSLGFLSVMLAYLYGRKTWMRWAMLLASVPVAVAANALRVALTAWLVAVQSPYATGWYHDAAGMLVFVACLPPLLGIIWALNRLQVHFP